MTSLGLSACWSLVRGRPIRSAEPDWAIVFQRCILERCAPLAWARSQPFIEANAPPDVSVKWASTVWTVQARIAAQLVALRELSAWLTAHDVSFVLVKGMPLSQRLYGEIWARPTDDLDLYIPPSQRIVALDLFRATGWVWVLGEYPGDIVLRKMVDGQAVAVDIHFALAGPWHQHLPPMPTTTAIVSVEGVPLRALAGPAVPVYLAGHLMEHARRPLLWLVDFTTLVESLSPVELDEASTLARALRLDRVFDLALQWSRRLRELPADADAVQEQTFIDEVLRPSQWRMIRDLFMTSASPGDAARVFSRFVWPEEVRRDPAEFLRMWNRRVRRAFIRRS